MKDQLTVREVLFDIRPLNNLSDRELTTMVLTAFFMAEESEKSDPTSLATKALKLAAAHMVEGATLELAWRN
jgi:hypothetical protein